MQRLMKKSKRISWASDSNLCQVRLFLSEDSPSQVGSGPQDHLEAKSSWLAHSSGTTDDALPPGFEEAHPENHLQTAVSEIPLINWKRPPKFHLILNWQVVAGDESGEVEVQNQRERRVLEAFYPGASAIPPNPSVSVDASNSTQSNLQIPLIPLTPIEDEDTVPDSSSDYAGAPGFPTLNASGSALNCEPDMLAAASTALTAIAKSNEQGNLIDPDLLMKILSNPKLIEQLGVNNASAPPVSNKINPASFVAPLSQPPAPVTFQEPSSIHSNKLETSLASLAATSSGSFYPHSNALHIPPPVFIPAPPQQKDINYYKSLIQQHGGERQEIPPPQQFGGGRYNYQVAPNHEVMNISRPKQRMTKPCLYFNSSRGCLHGANCSYQHDVLHQPPGKTTNSYNNNYNNSDGQSAKRVKLDREISS